MLLFRLQEVMMADVGRLSWQCLAGIQRLAASHSRGSVTESCSVITLFSRFHDREVHFPQKHKRFTRIRVFPTYIALTAMRYFAGIWNLYTGKLMLCNIKNQLLCHYSSVPNVTTKYLKKKPHNQ